jgi:hypothetical protein
MREIADLLEQLAREARAQAGERIEREPAEAAAPRLDVEAERTIAEAKRRLHEEADRAVAEAARVLERSVGAEPQTLAARIADATGQLVAQRLEREVERLSEKLRTAAREAEWEARGRLLAATEAAWRRIEETDRAQERAAQRLRELLERIESDGARAQDVPPVHERAPRRRPRSR